MTSRDIAQGVPAAPIAAAEARELRHAPFRPDLEAIAHTLVYQSILIGDLRLPPNLLPAVCSPTLVITGENSPPVLQAAAHAVAEGLLHGRLLVLDGQTHDIDPDATAAVIAEFLDGGHDRGEPRR